MMRELFGLERYELEPKVKILQNQNDTALQILKGQLTLIGDVQLADIEKNKAQLIELQEIIKQKQIEIEQYRKTDNELKQLKTDTELWQKTEKQNTDLAAQEGRFLILEKQIADY